MQVKSRVISLCSTSSQVKMNESSRTRFSPYDSCQQVYQHLSPDASIAVCDSTGSNPTPPEMQQTYMLIRLALICAGWSPQDGPCCLVIIVAVAMPAKCQPPFPYLVCKLTHSVVELCVN